MKTTWVLKGCPHMQCKGDLYKVLDDDTGRACYKCMLCGRELDETKSRRLRTPRLKKRSRKSA